MEELLKYFDLIAVIAAFVATSLGLSVVNQTKKGLEIHNGIIALVLSVFFSILLMDWTDFLSFWQPRTFQFSISVMVSTLFAVTRGQVIVDRFLGFLLGKVPFQKKDGEQ